jgi:hypothetical protein
MIWPACESRWRVLGNASNTYGHYVIKTKYKLNLSEMLYMYEVCYNKVHLPLHNTPLIMINPIQTRNIKKVDRKIILIKKIKIIPI